MVFLPPSIPFGNEQNPLMRKRTVGLMMKDIYDGLKAKGAKFGGMYTLSTPVLVPVDPEFVRSVLAKDFRCELSRFSRFGGG